MGGRGGHSHLYAAADVFQLHAQLDELLPGALRVGTRCVTLCQGDDDGAARSLRVVQSLPRLGLDAIVSGHDENDDVRNRGTPAFHRRGNLLARPCNKACGLNGEQLTSRALLRKPRGRACPGT